MKFFALLCCLLLCSCDKDRISQDRERRLRPVIAYMDAFISVHHRLPTGAELAAGTASMEPKLVLCDHTNPYAASHGCKAATDYMVGIKRVYWMYYYKSWDHSFLDGIDEH